MLKVQVNENETIEISDEERQPCERWSRVMGYFRPLEGWNIGKKQEWEDRTLYNEGVDSIQRVILNNDADVEAFCNPESESSPIEFMKPQNYKEAFN